LQSGWIPALLISSLKMEAACFSEMLVLTYKITQCHNERDHNLNTVYCS
jgi:hypothetical protein